MWGNHRFSVRLILRRGKHSTRFISLVYGIEHLEKNWPLSDTQSTAVGPDTRRVVFLANVTRGKNIDRIWSRFTYAHDPFKTMKAASLFFFERCTLGVDIF